MTAPVGMLKSFVRKSLRNFGYVVISEQRFDHLLNVAERAVEAPAGHGGRSGPAPADPAPEYSNAAPTPIPDKDSPVNASANNVLPALDAKLMCEIADAAYAR